MLPDFDFCSDIFEKNGLNLTDELYNKLDTYAKFLVEYNKNVNLTAIIAPEEILIKHFIDSILLCKYADIRENASLIDVGTGAGFPSVPLKLYRPDIKITLLDSLNKRIIFLKKLCTMLDIQADFVHERAEIASKDSQFRESFDIACARAVANMSLLSELCIPFVKKGGHFMAMKGPSEDISLGFKAVELLGGGEPQIIDYQLEDESRRIVFVKKYRILRQNTPETAVKSRRNCCNSGKCSVLFR